MGPTAVLTLHPMCMSNNVTARSRAMAIRPVQHTSISQTEYKMTDSMHMEKMLQNQLLANNNTAKH